VRAVRGAVSGAEGGMNKRALLAEARHWRKIAAWLDTQPVQPSYWPPLPLVPTGAMMDRMISNVFCAPRHVAAPSGEQFQTYCVLRSLLLAIECEEEARCVK
jgi:hypothetical protein